MINRREYQLEAIDAVHEFQSRRSNETTISLPTGVGKTIIFALLAKAMNTRTLIIAHTEELIKQAKEKLQIVWPEVDIGIVKAESYETAAKVVIASIQTISRENCLHKIKDTGIQFTDH